MVTKREKRIRRNTIRHQLKQHRMNCRECTKREKCKAYLSLLEQSAVTESNSQDIASDAETPSGSAKTAGGTTMVSTDLRVGTVDEIPELWTGQKIFTEVNKMLVNNFGARLVYMSVIVPTFDGSKQFSAFHPHFKKCGCEDCRSYVKSAKEHASMADEVGWRKG